MRTVVKDSNDVNISSTLDSDNQYNAEAAWPANANFLNVSNGGWHMATVTTNVNSAHGFLVYMDGQLAGTTPSTNTVHVLRACDGRTSQLCLAQVPSCSVLPACVLLCSSGSG